MARMTRITSASPMSPEERYRHEQAQAMERQRRGFQAFTRPERAEKVLGRTEGENVLQRATRKGQARRRR